MAASPLSGNLSINTSVPCSHFINHPYRYEIETIQLQRGWAWDRLAPFYAGILKSRGNERYA